MLLAHTRTLCSSGLLQHGWATANMLGRILLPLLAPGMTDLLPREGLVVLVRPAPPPSPEGAAQCAVHQAPSVLLACAALAWHLWRAEQGRRKPAPPAVAPAATVG